MKIFENRAIESSKPKKTLWCGNLPLRHKLSVVIMFTTVVALLLACLSFIVLYQIQQRETLHSELQTLARVIEHGSRAAIVFDDNATAQRMLDTLRVKKDILAAALYDKNGNIFAKYLRDERSFQTLPDKAPVNNQVTQKERHLLFSQGIFFDDERIGTVFLRSDFSRFYSHLTYFAIITAIILLASMIVAFLLASRLQGLIADPISRLVEAVTQVSASKDYTVRVPEIPDPDLGILIGGVNAMLDEIEKRDVSLLASKERAETADRAKSEFLAIMSHEIRTPISGVIGISELALETELTEVQKEYVETIYSSSQSLLHVLNDVLDFSKIEAGKLELNPVEFIFRERLEGLFSVFSFSAQKKGLKITHTISPLIPEQLVGDPDRIGQVLTNLVGNAIKFTEEGGVNIHVDQEFRTENNITLHFSVEDSGPGIPADEQRQIFQSFSQGDGSGQKKSAGVGLGLAICERLVDLMNGRIWLESEMEVGSVFHFTADFQVQLENTQVQHERNKLVSDAQKKERKNESIEWKNTEGYSLFVLVVEDNEVSQKVTTRLLEKMGCVVRVANNGKKAVQYTEQDVFDLILMDCQMPVMDGYEATRTIRENEKQKERHTPIIAMTAHVLQGDRERCLEAGMDEFISKPINSKEFQRIVLEVCNRSKKSGVEGDTAT